MRLTALFVFALIASGCALQSRGSTEMFTVLTSPPDAQVKLSNDHSCTSPCSTEIERRKAIVVSINKEGCQTENVTVPSRFDRTGWTTLGVSYPGLLIGSLVSVALAYVPGGEVVATAGLGLYLFFLGGITHRYHVRQFAGTYPESTGS